ncbi:MAG TPA: IclR family transcriptional regulator [Gemmatimonadaceae bacterium]|jgi:Transcriptional regulator
MLHKTMTVLELFSPVRREIGVIEAATMLKRPKSTVSRWLSAIADAGLLERDAVTGRYRLSMRLAVLGEIARESTGIQRLAHPCLEHLASTTGETCSMAVLVGNEGMNVDAVLSPKPIIHVGWVGRRFPLHASAAGKTLLAWRDEAGVKNLLPRRLPKLASRTITGMADFFRELERVRDQGYSTAWCELEEELAAVAAPVRDHTGAVIGALSISAPVSRVPLKALPALARAPTEAAAILSAQLGFHGAPGA